MVCGWRRFVWCSSFCCDPSLIPPTHTKNSGFTAVAAVNVIIVFYIVSAFREDKDDEKREPPPAVGVWAMQRAKERTD